MMWLVWLTVAAGGTFVGYQVVKSATTTTNNVVQAKAQGATANAIADLIGHAANNIEGTILASRRSGGSSPGSALSSSDSSMLDAAGGVITDGGGATQSSDQVVATTSTNSLSSYSSGAGSDLLGGM